MIHRRFSTYAAILTWGASGFMAQPSIASAIYHIFLIPPCLFLTIWLAHHEGKKIRDG